MRRTLYDDTHELFRESFRDFIDREMVPNNERWERERIVDRSFYRRAGERGFLCMAAPEAYGGAGVDDFRFNAVEAEEIARAGVYASGVGLLTHNDLCLPYVLTLTTDEQKARWLPGMCSGDLVAAIAMTEPGTGSDLAAIKTTALRDGDHYVLNGSKTFITNGINSDLVIVACKTDPDERHRGMTLLAVEAGMEGFERGPSLEKIGQHAQDTTGLFFHDVRVPVENLLGEEGQGFRHLVDKLAQERLSITVGAVAHARAAFEWTLAYCKERTAFGQPIASFQVNRFKFAEMWTELELAQLAADRQVEARNAGELTPVEAAMTKWWTTELNKRVLDTCLQLHGGYGYMEEYPIARAWRDGRVMSIYGGTTEIMKEIVGRALEI
ncbi:MAG TPA: acyl-CoA dehydrogenase family protein [Gaiellaceae bacterium]|jgi:alkylation response protein AidB-like acyl-CoA dehydrogenase